jgi:hypothetical protein
MWHAREEEAILTCLARKRERMEPLGRPKYRWNNINIDLKERNGMDGCGLD